MGKYKRITIKGENGYGIKGELIYQYQSVDGIRKDMLNLCINKIAELEDKIENKTLVEFKFSRHERVYFIDDTHSKYSCPHCGETCYEEHLNGIKSGFIVSREFRESQDGIDIIYSIQIDYNHKPVLFTNRSEENVFKTKELAEQKLKELNEQENERTRKEDEDYLWHSRAIAEYLEEQGYRKFPKDIIVLKVKDLEDACNEFNWITNYKILKHQEEAFKRCEQKVKQARKETAEKILEMFKSWEDKPYVSKEDFKRSIADLFGVEIKEQDDET